MQQVAFIWPNTNFPTLWWPEVTKLYILPRLIEKVNDVHYWNILSFFLKCLHRKYFKCGTFIVWLWTKNVTPENIFNYTEEIVTNSTNSFFCSISCKLIQIKTLGLKFRAYTFVIITLIISTQIIFIVLSGVDYLIMCHCENKDLNANYRMIFEPAASVVYLARLHSAHNDE